MPIYEYVCHNCGHEFEKIQGWSEDAPVCVSCGSSDVTRRLSPPAIHFKGSGWYITDSKNGKGKNGATGVAGTNGSTKNGDASTEGSGEARTDSASSKESDSSQKGESTSESTAKETTKTKSAA
ncbi:MAG: FmdB family zinc ribbon protein [Caldilineaceae bacterium]